MKKSTFRILIDLIAMLSMLAVTDCQRRPLNDETNELYLALDVDYNIKYNPPYNKPEAYKVLFFDSETDEIIKEEYVSPVGGKISVPPGTYNIIAMSMGAEYTKVHSSAGWESIYAYTDNINSRSFTENDIINMPDIIFTGTLENEVIPVRGTGQSVYTIYMEAKTPIETGKVIVRGVKGLKFISSVSAVISDLAEAKVLPSDAVIEEPAAIPVDLNVDLKTDEITNIFCSFGKIPNEKGHRNDLHLLIEDTAGNRFMQTFDVTDQVYACDTKDIIIIIDTDIEIPDPGHGKTGGGLEPVVGEWDDIKTTVPIGFANLSSAQMHTLTSNAIHSGKMPTERDFRMSGYFNAQTHAEGAEDGVYYTGVSSQNLFIGEKFAYNYNTGLWVSEDYPLFWPIVGNLDFLAFSSEDSDIVSQWGQSFEPVGDKCASLLSLSGFDETLSCKDDILYGAANSCRANAGGVPLEFCHAKALLVFTAKANEADAVTITGISLNDIDIPSATATKLTVTNHKADPDVAGDVDLLTAEWTGLKKSSEPVPVPGAWNISYNVPLIPLDVNGRIGWGGIGSEGIMLAPQAKTSFTVYYTQKGKEGTQSFTYDCRIGASEQDMQWKAGLRYVYNLEFNVE